MQWLAIMLGPPLGFMDQVSLVFVSFFFFSRILAMANGTSQILLKLNMQFPRTDHFVLDRRKKTFI